MPFTVEPTGLPEVVVVRPRRFADERGWFAELFRTDALAALGHGLPEAFAQANQSRSARGVVRGLHLQWDPPQGKLMRVVAGRAFVVAVDARPGSPTAGRHVGLELGADEPAFVWAPAWYARGFAALEGPTDVEYFCTAPWNPAAETAIRWDDPALGIAWPVAAGAAIVSAKDARAGTLAEWLARPEAATLGVRRA